MFSTESSFSKIFSSEVGLVFFWFTSVTFELSDFFPELFEAKQKCKFKNCLHLDEPDCNVKIKVKKGEIYQSRYNTYLDMLKDQNIYRKSDEGSNSKS